jgi:hypothetical protein
MRQGSGDGRILNIKIQNTPLASDDLERIEPFVCAVGRYYDIARGRRWEPFRSGALANYSLKRVLKQAHSNPRKSGRVHPVIKSPTKPIAESVTLR